MPHPDVSAIAQIVIAVSLAVLSLGSLTLVAKVAWGARGVVERQFQHQQTVLEEIGSIVRGQQETLRLITDLKEERGQISISYGVLSEKQERMSERMEEIASAVQRLAPRLARTGGSD